MQHLVLHQFLNIERISMNIFILQEKFSNNFMSEKILTANIPFFKVNLTKTIYNPHILKIFFKIMLTHLKRSTVIYQIFSNELANLLFFGRWLTRSGTFMKFVIMTFNGNVYMRFMDNWVTKRTRHIPIDHSWNLQRIYWTEINHHHH